MRVKMKVSGVPPLAMGLMKMRVRVIFESMYGNTREIAEAIAEGAGRVSEALAMPVSDARGGAIEGADLVIVGCPTHVRSMPRARTRVAAIEAANKADATVRLAVEPTAASPGIREWLDDRPSLPPLAAAFDTRLKAPGVLTGRASHRIARRLKRNGATLVYAPASFVVRRDNRLVKGEIARARAWGERVALRALDASQPSLHV